jgi:hypothetical protein
MTRAHLTRLAGEALGVAVVFALIEARRIGEEYCPTTSTKALIAALRRGIELGKSA